MPASYCTSKHIHRISHSSSSTLPTSLLAGPRIWCFPSIQKTCAVTPCRTDNHFGRGLHGRNSRFRARGIPVQSSLQSRMQEYQQSSIPRTLHMRHFGSSQGCCIRLQPCPRYHDGAHKGVTVCTHRRIERTTHRVQNFQVHTDIDRLKNSFPKQSII